MLTLGKRLETIRRRRVFREDGTHLSQGDLYRKAREIEAPPPKRRRGIGFSVGSGESRQAEIIRQFEKDERVPTEHQQELLERALEVPPGCLSHDFEEEDQIKLYLQQLDKLRFSSEGGNNLVVDAATTLEPPVLYPSDFVEGFDESSNRVINSRNMEVIEKLNAFVMNDAIDFRLICLNGESGSGKTHLLSDWYSIEKQKSPRRKIIAPDASRYNASELIASVLEKICGSQTKELNPITGALVDRAEPTVIVLDGLINSPRLIEMSVLGRSEKTTAVFDFIKWLETVSRKHTVIVGLQDEKGSDDPLHIELELSPNSKYLGLTLHELETEQAVELVETQLRALSGSAVHTQLPRDEIRSVCRRTDKLPITLEAICGFISGCQNTQEVEDFLVSDLPKSFRHEGFTAFFSSYLDKMDPISEGNRSHPVAVLRLLSLMPGWVPETWLEMLMSEVSVKRVKNTFFTEINQHKLPFLFQSGGGVDLHALARAELIRNTSNVLENDCSNPNLNGKENLEIHLAMAKVCRRIIKLRESKDFLSNFHARAIEHLVHHLICYRDLKVQLVGDPTPEASGLDIEGRVFSGNATAEEVTRYCWENVVSKFVLDRRHRFTRHLGQFERKSKLLRYFFPDQEISKKIQYLGRSEADEILKEISICHAHLGRLNSSLKAVKRATEHIDSNEAADRLSDIASFTDWMNLSDNERSLWISHFEAICHECLVNWRRSSQAAVVDNRLANYRSFFAKIANLDIDPDNFAIRPLYRAVRRFMTRDAHILLYRGEIKAAMHQFERAEHLEQRLSRAHLTGEAARRHIQALSRVSDDGATTREKVLSILEFNKKYLERQTQANRYVSTDVVAWLYTEAAFYRSIGDYDKAMEMLAQSESHPLHNKGQVPFFAQGELQIEKSRIANAIGHPRSDKKLAELIDFFASRDHNQLACEAMLTRCEARFGLEFDTDLETVESRFEADGWELRLSDVEIIRSGKRPSERFIF